MTRRFLPLFLLTSVLLVAAAPPTPPPAAPSSSQTPVVLIYPFDVQSGVDAKIGIAIAQILGQAMSAAGGIDVLTVPQNVARTNFLQYAQQQHADFYISGFVTPVGNRASVVEQVVSVDSGVILFSQTAQVSSVDDVASQSLLARAQILAFVNRGTQNIGAQTSNTPQPTSTNGTQVKIGGLSSIVDSVFHHRAASTPTPAPTTKPARGVIVAPVTAAGAVAPADLHNATDELYFALTKRYKTAITAVTSSVAQTADSICGPHRDNTIATGTLAQIVPKRGRRQMAFTLQVYTCFGAVLASTTGKGDTLKTAVDSAVSAYAAAHPDNS